MQRSSSERGQGTWAIFRNRGALSVCSRHPKPFRDMLKVDDFVVKAIALFLPAICRDPLRQLPVPLRGQ
jgi:hypothetical protein